MPKCIQQYPNSELSGSRYWTASFHRRLRGLPFYPAFSLFSVLVEAIHPTCLPRHEGSARIAKKSPRLNKNPRRCSMMDRVFRSIKNGTVKRYHQFHLTNAAEQKDLSCKLVFGMEKYFDAKLQALPNVRAWAAPCKKSQSVEHGGFDDDKATGLIRVNSLRHLWSLIHLISPAA